jgi:hypothetical protein
MTELAQVTESGTPLKDAAVDLIHSLQSAAPHVTEAVVKYTWAQGVAGLVGGVFLFAGAGVMAAFVHKCFKMNESAKIKASEHGRYYDGGWGAGAFFIAAFTVMLAMMANASIVASLPTVIAPEGAAVINIIEAARGNR